MNRDPLTASEYLATVPADKQAAVQQLRDTINQHLPPGFFETVSGNMLAWVVPHTQYPAGYHCDPKQPLPFVSLAAQKNFVALYHMGLYAQPQLLDWFQSTYPAHSPTKLDMGKSCIRFKKPEQIPYALIGELMEKMTPEQWIGVYEANLKPAAKKA